MKISKGDIYKYSLIFLLIFTCITDIATFFYSGLYEFEVNPIVLLLKGSLGMTAAIITAVSIKGLLVLAAAWFVYKYEPKGTHLFAFLVINTALLIIAIQIFGTYANINTTIVYNEAPVGTIVPMPAEESIQMLNIINIVYYCLMCLNMLSFWFYEKIYIKRPR